MMKNNLAMVIGMNWTIHTEACAAYDRGVYLSDNPYPENTENHRTWETSWLACRDIEVSESYDS